MDECLRASYVFSMGGLWRADGDTRDGMMDGAIVGGAVVPYSLRSSVFGSSSTQAGGWVFGFVFVSVLSPRLVFLPALSHPYLRGLISSPSSRASVVSGVA